jgi:hypothetical protein
MFLRQRPRKQNIATLDLPGCGRRRQLSSSGPASIDWYRLPIPSNVSSSDGSVRANVATLTFLDLGAAMPRWLAP